MTPGSHIGDIGCGPGRHALKLAESGFAISRFDISQAELIMAVSQFKSAGLSQNLVSAHCCGATEVPVVNLDAILLLGPLYHLIETIDRQSALLKARQCLEKSRGFLFAMFITRHSVPRDLLKRGDLDGLREIQDSGYWETGIYLPKDDVSVQNYMPACRTDYAADARAIIEATGFEIREILSVEGIASFMRPYVDEHFQNEKIPELVEIIEKSQRKPQLLDMSDHIMVVASPDGK